MIFWKIPVITKKCFQNIWKTFHENIKDIPGISPKYSKVMKKILLWSQKVKKIAPRVILWKFSYWQSHSLQCFSELCLNRFSFRVTFWKGSDRCLTAGKNLKIARYYNTRIYNLNSGPHIIRFSAVVAKKRKNFE